MFILCGCNNGSTADWFSDKYIAKMLEDSIEKRRLSWLGWSDHEIELYRSGGDYSTPYTPPDSQPANEQPHD